MIKAVSYNVKNVFLNSSLKNKQTVNFNGKLSRSNPDLFIKKQDNETAQDKYKKGKYLLVDSREQYEEAQKSAENIKQKISEDIKDENSIHYRTMMFDNGKKYIADVDFSLKDGSIQLHRIIKQNANGSSDYVFFDERGNIIRIANGLIHLENGETLINENFIYSHGIVQKVKLNTILNNKHAFTMAEYSYVGNSVKKVSEYIDVQANGKVSIGKEEKF